MIHISMYDATSIQGEDGEVGDGWGRVVGWLSAAESDFADAQGRAAALWHVRFDDVALGEEDLEEQEVKAAFIAWELATRVPCPPPGGGWRRRVFWREVMSRACGWWRSATMTSACRCSRARSAWRERRSSLSMPTATKGCAMPARAASKPSPCSSSPRPAAPRRSRA